MSATIIGPLLLALLVALAVRPFRRPPRLALFSWITTVGITEVPYLFLYLVVGASLPGIIQGDRDTGYWVALAVAVFTAAGLLVVVARSLRAGPVVERAMADGLGYRWRDRLDPAIAGRLRRHLPWARILFWPWMFGRHDVVRTRNVPYGPNGRSNLVDVYRHRSRPDGAPTLVYLHGGRFHSGAKGRNARPLLYHLAGQGWTCISANYPLGQPADAFPQNLIAVKRLLAWLRTEGHAFGVDPSTIVLVGGSAGAHLTAMAALTADDPSWQPGFEDADTSVAAAVGFYGYYGPVAGPAKPPSTPLAYSGEAPPFLVVHGDQDTYVPAADARDLVAHLRRVSTEPVVYVELPGAQHSFDTFHSVRFETVVDTVEAFAAWVRSTRPSPVATPPAPPGELVSRRLR